MMELLELAEQGAATLIALALLLFCYKFAHMHIITHCKTRNIEFVITDED